MAYLPLLCLPAVGCGLIEGDIVGDYVFPSDASADDADENDGTMATDRGSDGLVGDEGSSPDAGEAETARESGVAEAGTEGGEAGVEASDGAGAEGGEAGTVVSCSTSCSGICVDTQTDQNNCGSCGNACSAGSFCSSGARTYMEASCNELHTFYPSLSSGQYTIDPDGSGPVTPLSVYCDMTYNDGNGAGGWTLIESIVAGQDPSTTTSGVVTEGTTTAMPLATVEALAAISTQVHIRTPGEASTQSVTSVANSSPIVHLRAGRILNSTSDSEQYQNWTGPYATSAYLDFSCSTSGYNWPSVYWACGNTTGLTLDTTCAEWQWGSPSQDYNAFEVYVR